MFCVLCHFDVLSGCRVEMWRNYFLNTMLTFFNIHLKKIWYSTCLSMKVY